MNDLRGEFNFVKSREPILPVDNGQQIYGKEFEGSVDNIKEGKGEVSYHEILGQLQMSVINSEHHFELFSKISGLIGPFMHLNRLSIILEYDLLDECYMWEEGYELKSINKTKGLMLFEEWMKDQFSSNKYIQISDTRRIKNIQIREYLVCNNIFSMLSVPICFDGEIVGGTGVCDDKIRQWDESEINMIHALNLIICQSLFNYSKEMTRKIKDLTLVNNKYDTITGLCTRDYMRKVILSKSHTFKMPVAIIIADINGLQFINESLGNTTGDALLKLSADILKKVSNGMTYAARWGGDEFLLVIEETSNEEASDICKNIKMICDLSGSDINRNTLSLGYSIMEDKKSSVLSHLKIAEHHLNNRKLLESSSQRSSVLRSMHIALQAKSHETEAHASRIASYSRAIGERLNLTKKDMCDLELVSSLHDIGKISICNSILDKPGKLNDDEWMEMKSHSKSGYNILTAIPELEHIANYVLCHHERWDGKGYPNGIKGDTIPLISRIISVVDAYDAMTNNRVYRKALLPQYAQMELYYNAATQFDPLVVSTFLDILLGK